MGAAGGNQTRISETPPHIAAHKVPGDSALVRYALPISLFLAVFAWAIPALPSADMWWHLRVGEYILQTHSVPQTDPFSYTVAGKPWIAQEWLAEVLIYLAFKLGGTGSLLLCFGVMSALAFGLVHLRSRGASFAARALALGPGVWTAAPTFSSRPQVFSLLLTAVVLYLLQRFRDERRGRLLIPLLPIMALWVNLHGAYILGPVLIGLAVVGELADYALGQREWRGTQRQVRNLLITLGGCLAMVPLNPNGAKMYLYPFDTLRLTVLQANIMEWRSPDFHLSIFFPFALLLFGTVAALVLSKQRPVPSEVILFCVFAYGGLRAMRNVSIFALVSVPLLAKYAALPAVHWREHARWSPRRIFALIVLGMTVPTVALSVRYDLSRQPGLEWLRFPKDAVAYIQQNNLPGPIFNSYDNGGYLMWKLYPQYRIYIDGRTDLYGEEFIQNFLAVYRGQVNPQPELDRYRVQTVIIEPGSALARELTVMPQWKRVFGDDRALVFTRATAESQP